MTLVPIRLKPNRRFPSIPNVADTLQNHTEVLTAIKEAVEVGKRDTPDVLNSYVRVKDLVDMGFVTLQSGLLVPAEFATGGGGGGAQTAAEVPYSNGASGLHADNVQDAIDEIAATGGTDDQEADEVPYDDSSTRLGVAHVQGALEDIAQTNFGKTFRHGDDFLFAISTSGASGTSFVNTRDPVGYVGTGSSVAIASGIDVAGMIGACRLTCSTSGDSFPQVWLHPPAYPLNVANAIYRYKTRVMTNRAAHITTNPYRLYFGWRDVLTGTPTNALLVTAAHATDATGAFNIVFGVGAVQALTLNIADIVDTPTTIEIVVDVAANEVRVYVDDVLDTAFDASGETFPAGKVAPMARIQTAGALSPANILYVDFIDTEIRIPR